MPASPSTLPLSVTRGRYKEDDLADKVQSMLYGMRLLGVAFITVALVTQVPWIAALYYYTAQGVVYDALT